MNILHRAGEFPEDAIDTIKDAAFELRKIPRIVEQLGVINAAVGELSREIGELTEILSEKRKGGG